MPIKEALKKVVEGENLSRTEAEAVMDEIMAGEATGSQIGALITALRMKGEQVEEITGFAASMIRHATVIHPHQKDLVDTCGTGGDVAGTFNISTLAALVAAGAGVPVAKHGNRSVSSRCGSADLLEALGVRIDLPAEKVSEAIDQIGFGFIFAPLFHGAMRHAIGPRREIGIRTVFNILGPLTNPARAKRQILGVYDPNLTETMAEVLKNLGSKHVLVVHGMDGLDEISLSDRTRVSELLEGEIKTHYIQPEDFDLPRAPRAEILGGESEENQKIAREILEGKNRGAKRDVVLLNAAAAIRVGGKANTLNEGLEYARQSLTSGAALEKLNALVKFSST